jgi:hypothetical protein
MWTSSAGVQRWITANWLWSMPPRPCWHSWGPVGRTHNPAVHLRAALEQGRFRPSQALAVRSLTEKAELLGPDVHIQTDYGDEAGGRTPWELFDEEDARQALAMAEEAVALAKQIIQEANDE